MMETRNPPATANLKGGDSSKALGCTFIERWQRPVIMNGCNYALPASWSSRAPNLVPGGAAAEIKSLCFTDGPQTSVI